MVTEPEIIVDLFAGGGGASDGIETALGRHVTLAVDHSRHAIACHQRNHPHTHHEIADVWDVDPAEACAGRPVGLLWASPSCTHFSRAKGAHTPRSPRIRALPWVVIRWARAVRPRVILCENVPEWEQWGPLDSDGLPIKSKAGRTWAAWVTKLRSLGYAVEWRTLVAADYGVPTTRKRLYLIARRDGEPIVWPTPTHSKERSPSRAPWRTAAECIDWSIPVRSIFGRKRPLAESTLRRIAAGVMRFVVMNPSPFVVPVAKACSDAHDDELAMFAPSLAPLTHQGGDRVHSVEEPMRTVTAAHSVETALIAATLVQSGYGEREGQEPRLLDVELPLGTVVAGSAKHALVSAFMSKHFGGVVGQPLSAPMSTITAIDHHAVTTVALGPTERRAEVTAFLRKYYSGAPLRTITTRDREAVVTVDGVEYEIVDIGMRMLAPHELFAAQGFRASYDLSGLTKTQQIQICGNSVCPPVAEALVRANLK